MAERFHILMPCAKPHFIPAIAPSILQCEAHPFELRWHICQQGTEPDGKGFRKINEAIGWFKDGWFWAPSDDSLHYPNLIRRAGEIISSNPGVGCIVVSEDRGKKEGNRIMRASSSNVRVGEIDGSQCIWSRDFVGDDRFPVDDFPLTADGVFAERLFSRSPERFHFLDQVLVRFNSLDP